METSTETAQKNDNEKFCSECGELINLKAELCPKCGVRQMAPSATSSLGPVTPNGKNKVAAALFAFFLGGIGGHKFYLGQTGQGILYLVLFWTCIPALIALIEFVILLTMSDEQFAVKYGSV